MTTAYMMHTVKLTIISESTPFEIIVARETKRTIAEVNEPVPSSF